MNIIVLIKQVPDTETRIKIAGDHKAIDPAGIKWILSPFDEYAIEEALRLRDKHGGSVTALSMGPDRAVDALRTAFAMGADRGVHIKQDAYNELDVAFTAAALAKFLSGEKLDLILAGHTAIDSQSSMVPAMVAEHLGIVSINHALQVNVDGTTISVKREIEGGSAVMEGGLPVVVTATKNLNEPRYPSLKGIMAAKKKQVESVAAESLGVGVAPIEVVSMELPPPRPPGRILDGETPAARAAKLAHLLREEAKVI